jgi:hypothetical protein
MTLPRAVVDIAKKDFTPGLSYVAVSRVKKLDDLMFEESFDHERFKSKKPSSIAVARAADDHRRRMAGQVWTSLPNQYPDMDVNLDTVQRPATPAQPGAVPQAQAQTPVGPAPQPGALPQAPGPAARKPSLQPSSGTMAIQLKIFGDSMDSRTVIDHGAFKEGFDHNTDEWREHIAVALGQLQAAGKICVERRFWQSDLIHRLR